MDKRYDEKKQWRKKREQEDPMFIEIQRERQRNWYHKHKNDPDFKEKHNASSRKYSKKLTITPHQKRRIQVFEILGDKCKECGFSDKRALQVDHIFNNGYKH